MILERSVKKLVRTPGQCGNEGPVVLLAVINPAQDTNDPGGHVTSGSGC